MRKIVMSLIFLFGSNIFAAVKTPDPTPEPVVGENAKPVRIAFFIGGSTESFCYGGGGAITNDFACALSQSTIGPKATPQKAFDIAIVSDYIVKNLILRKYSKVPDKTLAKIELNLKNFDIYHIKDTQFFVFVPSAYNKTIFNKETTLFNNEKWSGKINLSTGKEYKGDGSERFPIISWDVATPIEAKRLLSNENLKYIPYAKDLASNIPNAKPTDVIIYKNFELKQLSLIFKKPPVSEVKTITVNKKPIKYELYELSSMTPCNIFMFGHGSYSITMPELVKIAGLSYNDMASTLLFFNNRLNTKSVRLSSCVAGGRILDLIQVKKDLAKKDIPVKIKYLLIVDSITDAPTTSNWKIECLPDAGVKGYFDALEIFQKGYEVFGDTIAALKAEKNKDLEQAINNNADKSEIKKIKERIAKEIKFEAGKLEKIHVFEVFLNKLALHPSWYFNILGPNSFPQFWIPEVGWFQTFNINSSAVQKITDAKIIKALAAPTFVKNEHIEIEDVRENPPLVKNVTIKSRLKKMNFAKSETVEVKGKQALLLYSEIVFANVNIISGSVSIFSDKLPSWLYNLYKYFPSIPCLDSVCEGKNVEKDFYIYPQIISMQHGNSINLFAKITLPAVGSPTPQNGILNFLRDSFLILRERISTKIIFIKELKGFNDFSVILNKLNKSDDFCKELGDKETAPQQITLQNVFIKTSYGKGSIYINISFEFNKNPWVLRYIPKDLNPKDPVEMGKAKSLWRLEKDPDVHEDNLSSAGLKYLARLTFNDYYAQLPVIRDIFHQSKVKNPSLTLLPKNPKPEDIKTDILSFKDFLVKLKPEDIKNAMRKSPDLTKDEWMEFEQQTNLKLKLKKLKTSVVKLKQKLELLNSKLKLLKSYLTDTV